MLKQKTNRYAFVFFAVLTIVYLGVFLCLSLFTGLYDITDAHNDRFFSSDDVYFATSFFNVDPEPSIRIIKHPLLCAFGWLFTNLEHVIFPGGVSIAFHYGLIVLLQIALSLVASVYLYKILTELYSIDPLPALLLTACYALAFSTVFYTFIAESFIFSSAALMLTYYCAGRKRPIITVILGALCAGITITNAVAWALIVLFGFPDKLRKRLLILVSGGLLFCALVSLTPFRTTFFTNILSGGLHSAESYSDHFPLAELLPRVFYIFFGSTFFYLDTFSASPFGQFERDALSFAPSAPVWVTAVSALWLIVLVTALILGENRKMILAPVAVLCFNIVLHGAIQYGLKEGFLYSQHHLSAQILIVSVLMSHKSKTVRTIALAFAAVFLICEVGFNIPGYLALLHTVP